MRPPKLGKCLPMCAVVACLCCPMTALADLAYATLSGASDEGSPVSATITLSWDGIDLIATVANTSGDNSVITGFGLMGGTASTADGDFTASGSLDDSEWFAANGVTLSPPNQFGLFAFAGDTPPDGLNAGDPNAGIEAGSSAVFSFFNLDSGLGSALDFLNTPNSNGVAYAVRFQRVGPDGEESAKVASIGGTPTPTPIPAPGAAALGFIGLGIVGWFKRRSA